MSRSSAENCVAENPAPLVSTGLVLTPMPHLEKPQTNAGSTQGFTDKAMEDALTKYRELYTYSTDVLLKEHERFNRADEKASKYSTIFVFLIGIVAYFEKWAFDRIVKQPDHYVDLPTEWPVLVVGGIALVCCGMGWFFANRVIMLRPYASRPLTKEVLEFFDKQSLLNIYDSFARRNISAYEENKKSTDEKYTILLRTHRVMRTVLIFLGVVLLLYCLYSLF